MARMNDSSAYYGEWSKRKLINQIRKYSNMESFGGALPDDFEYKPGFPNDHGPAIREATRIYRDSWLNPLIDELERRLIKG